MAVPLGESKRNIIEKISNIPAFDPLNAHGFNADCEEEGLCVLIQANSSREAAIKVGLMFVEFNALRNVSEKSSVKKSKQVVITDAKSHLKELYDVIIINGEIFVELIRILERKEAGSFDITGEEDTGMVTSRSMDSLHSTSSQLEQDLLGTTLRKYFGHETFLPLQKETIEATLAGKSALTVVGTGGGKTLMFLLPAILCDKLSLVVSPIKSLIDDTVLRCQNLGISACKFTGDVPNEVQIYQVECIQQYRVIVATPEMLQEGMLLKPSDSRP
jgi:superfamily II DNA helicase RecQ